jgi:hypothetical protein
MKPDETSVSNGHGNNANTASVSFPTDIAGQRSPDQSNATDALRRAVANRAESYQLIMGAFPVTHQWIWDHGYDVGIRTGATQKDESVLAALEDFARTAARESERDAFDPQTNPHDAAHEKQFQNHLTVQMEATEAEVNASVAVRESQKGLGLAKAGDPPSPPDLTIWWIVGGLCALGIACSIVLTLQAYFFAFSDDVTSWVVSAFIGMLLGVAVMLLILSNDGGGHMSKRNWIGLVAATLIAVAFAGVRFKDADSSSAQIFALSLALLEIGFVVGLESLALNRREKLRKHEEGLTEHAKIVKDEATAQAIHEANLAEHERRRQRKLDADQVVRGDIAYREERRERHLHPGKIEAAMVAAVRGGYISAIAVQHAKRVGAN